jgi:MarR family transcriptional regulator, transcriptional regulator for hemolysin
MQEIDALLAAFTPALLQAGRAWRREADEALSGLGLSHATAFPLLYVIREGDGIRQGVLAAFMGIEGPSLVRLLDQLETAGLIRREEDAVDRRAKTLHLTAAGRALALRAEAALAERRRAVFGDLGPETIAACLRAFARLQASRGSA